MDLFCLAEPGRSIATAGGLVLLVLAPSLLVGAVLNAPRWLRWVRQLRRADAVEVPYGPPIERIAAELTRLLLLHDHWDRSPDRAMRARRHSTLETAITYRATQAARALGVPHPYPAAHGRLDQSRLRALLRNLAAEGLVLPAAGLLAPGLR
jgi:hypothetical protein